MQKLLNLLISMLLLTACSGTESAATPSAGSSANETALSADTHDDGDGNVNITDTPEAFAAAARPDVDPAYQNYCVEGRIEWLENGAPVATTVLIPTTPVVGDSATPARGNLGVTLNGLIIAAPAPVDAILSAYTIAAFDDCGGHINPFEGYHLHGARGCSDAGEATAGETPIFAYALDGYPIHSPFDAQAGATTPMSKKTRESESSSPNLVPAPIYRYCQWF